MKKHLIAIAALAACGTASAQSNVTVYGVTDAGITYETGDQAGSAWKLATGVQSGNRLGFKGSEDLGGGLAANFQIEAGFNLAKGTSKQDALFGRQAHVGLSGPFGAIDLGRNYNPFFNTLDSIDPFGTGLTGSSTNLMNSSSVRTNSSLVYSSPNINGLSGSFLYGFGEQPGDAAKSRTVDFSVGYAGGPLNVTFAYDNVNDSQGAASTKLALVGGTYDFGVATLHLAYETEKDDAAMDFRDLMLGLSVPVGKGTFIASYIDKTDKSGAGNASASQYAIGYTYALSKRTNFYTSYSRVNNRGIAAYVAGDASDGGAANQIPGHDSSGLTVGVRHKF
jgi:predicted porin